MYSKNVDLPAGRVAWGNGLLLHRPVEYDKEANCPHMAQTLDPDSLKVRLCNSYSLSVITSMSTEIARLFLKKLLLLII